MGTLADLLEQHRTHRLTLRRLRQTMRTSVSRRQPSPLAIAAFWALRRSHTGWALVIGGKIATLNPGLVAIARGGQSLRRWHSTSDAGGSRPVTLHTAVVTEALRLADSDQAIERRLVSDDGITVLLTAERSEDGHGPRAVLVEVTDVTALVEAEAQARAAQEKLLATERLRAAGELALGIGHDVNNVLGALALRIDLLLRDDACQRNQRPNIEALKRIVGEGVQLVRKLQSMGRTEDRRIGPVDLGGIITDAIEIARSGLRLGAAEGGVQLRIETDVPELPPVAGSPDELRHVFVNLLVNARHAMPSGGTIRVTAHVRPDHVTVTVGDEGTGIDARHLPRIFDAFFTTKGALGSGLGLAMAKAVMERAGGDITARNLADRGAAFDLRFSRVGKRADDAPRA